MTKHWQLFAIRGLKNAKFFSTLRRVKRMHVMQKLLCRFEYLYLNQKKEMLVKETKIKF